MQSEKRCDFDFDRLTMNDFSNAIVGGALAMSQP